MLKTKPNTNKEIKKLGGKILELHSEKMVKKGKKVGRAEERKDGIRALIAAAKDFSASQAQTAEQLMKRYSMTKDEALAAVQANW